MSSNKKQTGLLALFEGQADFLGAIKKIRGRLSIKKLEAFSPFPVHGIEQALGLKRSWIPYATLVLALSGFGLGFLLQAWTSAYSWPLNVGGKPFISWPAFIPVSFETMILMGGVSTTLILYIACNLPNYRKPVLDTRLTNNLFGLYIDKSDENFNEAKVTEILKETHVLEIKQIEN